MVRFERVARLLTLGLLGGVAFLFGHPGREAALAEQTPVAQQRSPSAEAMSEAWASAERAQGLAEGHQATAALADAQHAYDLSRDPTLLLDVARLERIVGHAARATHAFEVFLAQSGDRVPRRILALAARQREASASCTARVAVQTNVLGASVELEPERGVASSSGFVVSILLDAGERRISFNKPGYETRTLLLQLEAGETRTLRVDLDKADAGHSESGSQKPRWTRLPTRASDADG